MSKSDKPKKAREQKHEEKMAKALAKASKVLEEASKLRQDREQSDPATIGLTKPKGSLYPNYIREAMGLVCGDVHESVNARFLRDYNSRVPMTLLLLYAMDAVDDGRITLPSFAEAKRQFNVLSDLPKASTAAKDASPDAKRQAHVVKREYDLTLEQMLSGKDEDGQPLPEVIQMIGRELQAKMQQAAEDNAPDVTDVVKQETEANAPDAPTPNTETGGAQVIRFSNNPFETNHDHDL